MEGVEITAHDKHGEPIPVEVEGMTTVNVHNRLLTGGDFTVRLKKAGYVSVRLYPEEQDDFHLQGDTK